MKNVFVEAMRNTFDLSAMLQRINAHHIMGNLSDADRAELEAMARQKADPFGGLDVAAKLRELDERVKVLEEAKGDNNASDAGESTDTVPEYVAGKWYYKGDKVMHIGGVYTCIAPDGVVCVWSPTEYPAYWQEIS